MKLIKRETCPFCQSNHFKSLYKLDYNSKIMTDFLINYYKNTDICEILKTEEYEITECLNCNGSFQRNIPNEKLSLYLYEVLISNEESFQKKKKLSVKKFKEYFNDAEIIEKIINKKSHEIKILEFGCGWGFWANFMKSMNFNIETLEISSPRKKHLNKINIKNYDSINEIDTKYDLIFSNQAIEHIPEPLTTLSNLKDKLKVNGIMYHKFPSTFFFKNKLSKNYIPHKDCAHPLEHINLINKDCFKKISQLLEMRPVKVKKINLIKKIQFFKNRLIFNNIILKK
jgi:2-polyprenyl-3-methyl-5-hydroxy-6-metoxy-1,4-benzoquinol methylase